MCLAIPVRVIHIDNETDMATVTVGGVEKQASLALLDDVAVDDYVLLHVGYALNKISEEEAQKTLALFAEAGVFDELS